MKRNEMMSWLSSKGYIIAAPSIFRFIRTLHYTNPSVKIRRYTLFLSSFKLEQLNGNNTWKVVLQGQLKDFRVNGDGLLSKR